MVQSKKGSEGDRTSLGETTADYPGSGYEFPHPPLLLPIYQKDGVSLTSGHWQSQLGEFGLEDFWDDDAECQAEVCKHHYICPWRVDGLVDVAQS